MLRGWVVRAAHEGNAEAPKAGTAVPRADAVAHQNLAREAPAARERLANAEREADLLEAGALLGITGSKQ